MYEHFKQQVLAGLSDSVDTQTLDIVASVLDRVSSDYIISHAETLPATTDCPGMELVQMYLVSRKLEGMSDGTLNNYRIILRNFFQDVMKEPENLKANDIRLYLYRYQKERGCTDRSLDKVRQGICAFLHWASLEEYIDKDISIQCKKIKYEEKPRKSLTQVQLEYIRLACKSDLRTAAMVEFMYSTGCRVSEMCNAKKSDINRESGSITLFGKGKKYRTSYINAKCSVALAAYLATRDDESEYIFVSKRSPHGPITYTQAENIIRELSDRVYPTIGVRFTPHIFRHTTATTALRSGMPVEDISKLLGHSQISTTMIYAKVSQDHVHSEHTRCVI